MMDSLAVRQVDIGGWVTGAWGTFLSFLPRAVGFIVILVVGWIIAKIVLKGVNAILERVGFDRAVERGGVKKALERSKYDASDILARIGYYFVLLFTLQFAFGIWGPNAVSDLISGIVAWIPRAFVAIVIVVIAAAIANAVRDIVTGTLGGLSYGRFLADVAAVFVLALGVIAALNTVGIATSITTPILVAVLATIAGILIVGVGGGLIRPMQARWEHWIQRAEQDADQIRGQRQKAQAVGASDLNRQMADRSSETQQMPRAEESAMSGKQQGQGVYRSGGNQNKSGR